LKISLVKTVAFLDFSSTPQDKWEFLFQFWIFKYSTRSCRRKDRWKPL